MLSKRGMAARGSSLTGTSVSQERCNLQELHLWGSSSLPGSLPPFFSRSISRSAASRNSSAQNCTGQGSATDSCEAASTAVRSHCKCPCARHSRSVLVWCCAGRIPGGTRRAGRACPPDGGGHCAPGIARAQCGPGTRPCTVFQYTVAGSPRTFHCLSTV
jgi:hypothetical protein